MTRDKKPYNILVVEDNLGDFVIVEDFLREQIYEPTITRAVDFRHAAGLLSQNMAHFDVILLDLSLPDGNGEELVTNILKMVQFCPVIVLTGYTDVDFSIKSIGKGISDYLVKDDLNSTILYKSITYAIERKKELAQLAESEERYSNLFHLSPQPKWVLDPQTLFFFQVNRAAIELYGYSREEFMSMTVMDIKADSDIVETKEQLRRVQSGDKTYKRTYVHRKKSGEKIEVEIFASPVTINGKSYTSVLAIDVTEKRLFEQKMLKAIIKTQEDERYEIGGELHDNVCQILAASQISLSMLKKSLAPAATMLYDDCRENILLALDEIRSLSHRLAPAFFDDSNLEEAFERLFRTIKREGEMEVVLHFDKGFNSYPISLELKLNLYRIMQEQLKNIMKYSKASLIEVDILVYKGRLKMRIRDDGVGFNVEKERGGIGIANMKRRTELFYGRFEVCSSPGKGCEILLDIPVPFEPAGQ